MMANICSKESVSPFIEKADSQVITDYFHNSINFISSHWINSRNHYKKYPIKKFDQKRITNESDLIEYIAVSGPGHVIDGWSFLGRAIDSLLKNDFYTAIHLAYYAELRAAMGLLAVEGIGAFNNSHVVVTANNEIHAINFSRNNGTHNFTWAALTAWSELSKSANTIDNLFSIEDISLNHWLNETSRLAVPSRNKSNVSSIATSKQLINAWSLDLDVTNKDRELRNHVSYRPEIITPLVAIPLENNIDFISELWNCFEPDGKGDFANFNFLLFKHEIMKLIPKQNITKGISLATHKARLCQELPLSPERFDIYAGLFNKTKVPEFFLHASKKYNKKLAIESNDCCFQIISRAALLLRLSTSLVRNKLNKAGVSRGQLDFWWLAQVHKLGIVGPSTRVDNLTDLYEDIKESLKSIRNWLSNTNNDKSQHYLIKTYGFELNMIGAFELVGIWGLLP